MIICLCEGIRVKDVKAAVRGGAHTITQLSRACGAGKGCGACHEELKKLLHAHGKKTAHTKHSASTNRKR